MNSTIRVIGVTLLIASLGLLVLFGTVSAAGPTQYQLPLSPISTGALMAQAVHAGLVVPGTGTLQPNITCTPLPCVLKEVNASSRTSPANENPIVVDPNNALNLLTGANDYTCAAIQGAYASTDGGATWARTCFSAMAGFSGAGDPGVAYDLNGNAYFTGINIGTKWVIVYMKSTNHGVSWSAPAIAVNPLFTGGLTDKEWTAVDVTPTSPYKNTIYISVTQFDSGGVNGAIGVTHSSDGGATWKTVQASDHSTGSDVIQFSDLAIAKDGTVYVSWLKCPGQCSGKASNLFIAKSTDQGNTWTTPMKIAGVTLVPGSSCYYGCLPHTSERVSNMPVIDVDNSGGAHNGRVYVTFYNWTGSFMQVMGSYSDDGGATWVAAKPISKQNTDQFFPWLSVSSAGRVGLNWLDRRNDPSDVKYEAFGALYIPGAVPPIKGDKSLSTSLNDPFKDGFGGSFMGDYDTNYWTPDGKTLYYSYCGTYTGTCQDWVTGFETP